MTPCESPAVPPVDGAEPLSGRSPSWPGVVELRKRAGGDLRAQAAAHARRTATRAALMPRL
ncbi:hypothetical protein ACN20G_01765 [Streptomyces sp. BI20]|uniref:hypothetical protein n=1 Tax=Streptomyces sp. BI20 TaxID=3403460 RepID=UPI003C771BD1